MDKQPQQQETKKRLCNDCRRKIYKGIKVVREKSKAREFCYAKQCYLENLNPIICNGFKKIFEPTVQNVSVN